MSKFPKIKIDPDSMYANTPSKDVPTRILIARLRHVSKELIVEKKFFDDHIDVLEAVVERLENPNKPVEVSA